MGNLLERDIVVSEFELHSSYYVHFQTNIKGEAMNSIIPQRYESNNTPIVLLRG